MKSDPRRLASAKKWRAKNREAYREIERRCYLKNHAKRLAAGRAHYALNREDRKRKQRERHKMLKDAAYEAYGGYRCVCCGETEPLFLCLDHVNDDGAAHRREVKPEALYFWLKKNGYPPIVQVLCHNCNYAKRYGPCPHGKGGR